MSPQERILYSAIVDELGGEVCSSQGFSPNCTHVIVGRPSRSEKYLAAGKWVISSRFSVPQVPTRVEGYCYLKPISLLRRGGFNWQEQLVDL